MINNLAVPNSNVHQRHNKSSGPGSLSRSFGVRVFYLPCGVKQLLISSIVLHTQPITQKENTSLDTSYEWNQFNEQRNYLLCSLLVVSVSQLASCCQLRLHPSGRHQAVRAIGTCFQFESNQCYGCASVFLSARFIPVTAVAHLNGFQMHGPAKHRWVFRGPQPTTPYNIRISIFMW